MLESRHDNNTNHKRKQNNVNRTTTHPDRRHVRSSRNHLDECSREGIGSSGPSTERSIANAGRSESQVPVDASKPSIEGNGMNRGGRRKGAGRKPAPAGTIKVQYCSRLCPIVVRYLKTRKNAAATIEESLRRGKEFKEWEKSRPI